MSLEPYILFSILSLLMIIIVGSYYALKKFEIVIFLFAISPWLFSMFFLNIPEWINEEIPTGPGGYLRGAILLFVGSLGFIKFFRRFKIDKDKLPIHLVLLGVFLFISFISINYSLDQRYTFIRVSLFTAVFFFLIGLNSWMNDKENFPKMMNTLYIAVVFLAIVSFLALLFWSSRVWWWKTPSRFLGLWSHPNEVGGFSMLAYPILLWKLYNTKSNSKYYVYLVLIITLIMHLLSGSRTSLVASVIGILLWFLLERNWIKVLVMTMMITIGGVILYLIVPSSLDRGEDSKITDLTQREDIWETALYFAKEKPILGYGYGVEGKIFADQLLVDVEGQHFKTNAQQPLHNGFLSIFIGGGAVGLLLLLIIIIIPFLSALANPFSYYKLFSVVVMVMVLVSNLVESALTGYNSVSDIFFWFAWVVAAKLYILDQSEKDTNKITEHK